MSFFKRALQEGSIRRVTEAGGEDLFLEGLEGAPLFACVIGSTKTALIEGISAAGATPEKRRFTAALDSEFLIHGRPLSLPDIPRNPEGPPSPVVITHAALKELGVIPLIVDSGTEVPPKTPLITLGFSPGEDIRTGRALTLTQDFKSQCRAVGRALANQRPWVILSESVPGGTTTALSLLEALGVGGTGMVSSSMPGGNHSLKEEVVRQALKAAALKPSAGGLEISAAVGDPMQPALALMALEASLHVPVVLGGGTQMAAVYALMARLTDEGEPGDLSRVALATTSWVAADPAADLKAILHSISPTPAAFAAWLDFSASKLLGLRRYEEGLVKEGVGAGAAAFAAFGVTGIKHDDMVRAIEVVTEGLDDL
ncbi:MAG: TIGR00303 family protein [Deltaproteobacteria bacterium]|nr:MAG: TIGR00303 family protein [Deltaproteobacteria bacterium]